MISYQIYQKNSGTADAGSTKKYSNIYWNRLPSDLPKLSRKFGMLPFLRQKSNIYL